MAPGLCLVSPRDIPGAGGARGAIDHPAAGRYGLFPALITQRQLPREGRRSSSGDANRSRPCRDFHGQKLEEVLRHRQPQGMDISANVTLDPDTANPFLLLAGDRRGVGRGDEWSSVPATAERFDTEPCVLGSQGFATGRHCWAVEVAEGGDWWALGVAQESVRRKGVLSFTPQEGIWAVGQWFGQYFAFTDPDWTPLHLPCRPRAIQVCLDFTDRQVAFADAENKAPIFAFCLDSCPGEKLRPWLWVGTDSWLQLCP